MKKTLTIAAAFTAAVQQIEPIYGVSEARNMMRIYFEDVFQIINLQRTEELSAEQIQQLNNALVRLQQHEPLQYIIGETEFFGYKFKVTPAVLIPRPETEELVDLIIQNCKKAVGNLDTFSMLDIGTGSGCIPIVLKKKLPNATVSGLDVSAEALAVAQHNAAELAADVAFFQLDILNVNLWREVQDESLQVIVSNPPYIPLREKALMAKNVLDYEPGLALFVSDRSPLIFYKMIVRFAVEKLSKNGRLFFECNEYNAAEVAELLTKNHFAQVEIVKDMSGKNRIVMGVLVEVNPRNSYSDTKRRPLF